MTEYRYKKQLKITYEEAVEKAEEELKKQGFGVLTKINVKDTLKNKLNVDFNEYIILGACNPPFAYKALQAEKDIGLMLPCNVIVYEQEGSVYVASILPTIAMAMIDNPKLKNIAEEIENKLKKVIESL